MDNFKEKLGKAFMPVVEKFSDWLTSDEAQNALEEIAGQVQKFGEWFASPEGQESFKGWLKDLKTMIKLAGDFLGLAAEVAKLLSEKGVQTKVLSNRPIADRTGGSVNAYSAAKDYMVTAQIKTGPTTINITEANNAKTTLDNLRKEAKSKGLTVERLLVGLT